MTRKTIVPPRRGLLHVLDAARHPLAGLRRLWRKTASRLEFVGAGVVAIAFARRGAEVWHRLVAAALFAPVQAVQALNTGIEMLTDRLSPEWSEMARDAKGPGVACRRPDAAGGQRVWARCLGRHDLTTGLDASDFGLVPLRTCAASLRQKRGGYRWAAAIGSGSDLDCRGSSCWPGRRSCWWPWWSSAPGLRRPSGRP